MKPLDWNEQKNALLKATRGIGFEDVVNAINEGHLLTVLQHPNHTKYPNQKVYIVAINNYAYSVPFIENKETCFLKTIYPSRKYAKKYLKEKE
jgi:uncharacterized DUF497 family protein